MRERRPPPTRARRRRRRRSPSPSAPPEGDALPVLKAEQEKQAAIILTEGESESARVISAALQKSPALVELRRIEAAKDIADTLSRSRNVTYLLGRRPEHALGLGATGAS